MTRYLCCLPIILYCSNNQQLQEFLFLFCLLNVQFFKTSFFLFSPLLLFKLPKKKKRRIKEKTKQQEKNQKTNCKQKCFMFSYLLGFFQISVAPREETLVFPKLLQQRKNFFSLKAPLFFPFFQTANLQRSSEL